LATLFESNKDRQELSNGPNIHNPYDLPHGSLMVGEGVVIRGEFTIPNSVIIAGTIEGSLTAKDVTIKATGSFQGKVRAERMNVAGSAGNDLTVTELLILQSTCEINGKVAYHELELSKGAKLQGTLTKL